MLEFLSQGETSLSSVWGNPYLTGFFGALLGLLSAYLIELWKSRKAPRRELSWDYEIEAPQSVRTDGSQQNLKISYGDYVAEELVIVRYRVANTGTEIIQDQQLRFDLPSDAVLLETFLNPDVLPESEVRVVQGETGSTWVIGHLDLGHSVQFNFICDGGSWEGWSRVIPKNMKAQKVKFERRGAAKVSSDKDQLRKVLQIGAFGIVSIAAASVLSAARMFFVAVPLYGLALILCVAALPLIPAAMRALALAITERHSNETFNVIAHGSDAEINISHRSRFGS